jgi:hypothetical protein
MTYKGLKLKSKAVPPDNGDRTTATISQAAFEVREVWQFAPVGSEVEEAQAGSAFILEFTFPVVRRGIVASGWHEFRHTA